MAEKKRNIFLHDVKIDLAYSSEGMPIKRSFPIRSNPREHAEFIERQLRTCQENDLFQRQIAATRYKDGLYLEFSSEYKIMKTAG